MRRLEVAELSLASLDALDVDALVVLVGLERPGWSTGASAAP